MKYLPKGNAMFLIGYISYVIGSFYGRMSKQKFIKYSNLENKETQAPEKKITMYALIVFGISIIFGLLYYKMQGKSLLYMLTLGQMEAEGVTNNSSAGFLFLSCFIRSAIPSLLMLLAFSKIKKVWLVIASLMTVLITVTTGSRNLTIATVIAIFVYLYLEKLKRPRWIALVGSIIVLYLFVGFVGVFRGDMLNGGSISLSKINRESLLDAFMYNVEIFFPFYNLVERIPKYSPYHYGLGFLNVIIQFIPHAIWPNKPAMLGVSSLTAIYGNSFGGAAYPNIGSFYYEFGVLGVIIFMYAFGYVGQKLYWKGISSKDKFRKIQFAMMFGYLFQFVCRSSISSWAIDIVFMFGPIWVIKYFYKIQS
jgi:oligosaccharide repeat unit polymerase